MSNQQIMPNQQQMPDQNQQEHLIEQFYHPRGASMNMNEVAESPKHTYQPLANPSSLPAQNKTIVPTKSIKFQPPHISQSVNIPSGNSVSNDYIDQRNVHTRQSEMNIEAEGVEQERYFARLKRATQKQNQIFQQHLNKYYLPQRMKEKRIQDEEDFKYKALKQQALNYEKQKI